MKTVLSTLFLLLLLSAAGIGGFGFLQYEKFTKQRVSENAPKTFEIKKGSNY